jgi:predicted hotdog family 3-hydroxylacyl-ACP dehydratase
MLNREAIASRIPHQGRMCLLDRVVEWSDATIRCETGSHRAPDNPLRTHGRLGIACGIEYAAQAMAVHGALVAQTGGGAAAPRLGYLASVRAVRLGAQRLDDIPGELTVRAERIVGDADTIVYDFYVQDGERTLLSGRATVVLAASAAMPPGAAPKP